MENGRTESYLAGVAGGEGETNAAVAPPTAVDEAVGGEGDSADKVTTVVVTPDVDEKPAEKRTQLAQAAYAAGDVEASISAHNFQVEPHGGAGSDYVKSIVFGGLDGIITTFAVVASVQGADLGTKVVLIMGVANLIADGVSMGFGEFLSGDAEKKYILSERGREAWEMKHNPTGEIEEMIELYQTKGFDLEQATTIVTAMSTNKEFFIDHMMVQELGMQVPDEDDSPLKQGMAMFCSFMVFGFIPLLAFIAFSAVVTDAEIFAIACVLTACALFGLGAFSSRFNNSHWFRSGLWVLLNGTTASAVAYLVGFALSEIVGSDDCDTLGNFTVTATI